MQSVLNIYIYIIVYSKVSLLSSALYAMSPYYVVLYAGVLCMEWFVCKVSLVCSELYPTRPWYLVLYV